MMFFRFIFEYFGSSIFHWKNTCLTLIFLNFLLFTSLIYLNIEKDSKNLNLFGTTDVRDNIQIFPLPEDVDQEKINIRSNQLEDATTGENENEVTLEL